MERELIAFNKDGTKYGRLPMPDLIYLQTEQQYINKALLSCPKLDGMVILIDWNKKDIVCKRN
jgi:hypothetical protein